MESTSVSESLLSLACFFPPNLAPILTSIRRASLGEAQPRRTLLPTLFGGSSVEPISNLMEIHLPTMLEIISALWKSKKIPSIAIPPLAKEGWEGVFLSFDGCRGH